MYYKVLLIVIIRILSTCLSEAEELKVCLSKLGCLQGTYMPGYQTEKFEAFMGIPFAKPPIGNLRFKNPEPITAWKGVLKTNAPKPDCMQKNYILPSWPISGDEDCLYLNLYRPLQPVTKNLPVMFYIYGGGFFSGSSNPGVLGPEYFMDTKEVILITVTYRLGPFGFLSTGDENMPGNLGLKDQNLALKWVQENVAAFGGDPKAVTIFGHSAGGSAVHFHMLSAASSGLFQRAVIMSGNALAPYVDILKDPLEQAVKIAEVSGIPNAAALSTSNLVKKLQKVDALKLLNAGDSLKFWHVNPLSNYRPVLEQATWSNAFLTTHPATLVKSGNFTHVPWMMGLVSNKGEGAVLTLNIVETERLRKEFNKNFDKIMSQMMEFPKNTPKDAIKMVLNMILDEYFHGVHELNNATAGGFSELFSDVAFYYPFYRSLKSYVQYGDMQKNPLYPFKFEYRGPYSYSAVYTGGSLKNFGVVHFDDLIYLFRAPLIFPTDFAKDSADAKLVKRLVGIYVDFAKHGKAKNFDKIGSCTKANFQSAGAAGICNYLEFVNDGNNFKEVVEQKFNVKRMQFWDQILGN